MLWSCNIYFNFSRLFLFHHVSFLLCALFCTWARCQLVSSDWVITVAIRKLITEKLQVQKIIAFTTILVVIIMIRRLTVNFHGRSGHWTSSSLPITNQGNPCYRGSWTSFFYYLQVAYIEDSQRFVFIWSPITPSQNDAHNDPEMWRQGGDLSSPQIHGHLPFPPQGVSWLVEEETNGWDAGCQPSQVTPEGWAMQLSSSQNGHPRFPLQFNPTCLRPTSVASLLKPPLTTPRVVAQSCVSPQLNSNSDSNSWHI